MEIALNKIQEVLQERNIEKIRPTEDQLDEWGITLHQWNKWIRKKSDPTLKQLYQIAEFLQCEMHDLLPTIKQSA